MNATLLIAVAFAAGLARAANNRPCLKNPDNDAYNRFVDRHVVQEDFDRKSEADWGRYIRMKGLCNRPKQSFFEPSDQNRLLLICNGAGHPLSGKNPGNLCMSDSTIPQYNMTVSASCQVTRLASGTGKVIVACDEVANQCRPVHFEKYTNQQADSAAEACRPPGLSGLSSTRTPPLLTLLLCLSGLMAICFLPY